MELVIENEKELEAEDNKEGIICHFFPLLKELRLKSLLGLKRFCDVAYTWTLPSLWYLQVSECPKLEALSPGYLDSPMLMSFLYDRSELIAENWKCGVNAALGDLKIKKMKKEKEEKMMLEEKRKKWEERRKEEKMMLEEKRKKWEERRKEEGVGEGEVTNTGKEEEEEEEEEEDGHDGENDYY